MAYLGAPRIEAIKILLFHPQASVLKLTMVCDVFRVGISVKMQLIKLPTCLHFRLTSARFAINYSLNEQHAPLK